MNLEYMLKAIELAKKGMGYTSPNPLVGCVVVKDNKIVAQGYHERIGGYHAERNALLSCKEDLNGAELYVTLEPCCHYGKTPPCTEIIMEKGIKKVYVGSMDPNPLVAGKGVEILRKNGVEVECGVLKEECDALNDIFFHYITTGTPYVIMKYAMTLDGKIACENGDSKWVTGENSRHRVQLLRKRCSAIMVGIGTVLADDPMLNCRIEEGVDPIRIICDSSLRIPLESNIVRTAKDIRTIVVCTREGANKNDKLDKLCAAGVEIIEHEGKRVDLKKLMIELGAMQIDSILLEGGATLNSSALNAGIVNEVNCFIAPKIVGGEKAKTAVAGEGVELMSLAHTLKEVSVEKVAQDILISGKI